MPTIAACLRIWYRFLAGREPSQEQADEFAAHLAAKHPEVAARRICRIVDSLLRVRAAESGVAPIVVRPHARIEAAKRGPRRPVPPGAERWLLRFGTELNRGTRQTFLHAWFGLLDGREPSQELADEFVAQLAAKHTEVTTRAFRSTVNSFLRANAAESGVPIAIRLNAAGGQRRGRRQASFRAE